MSEYFDEDEFEPIEGYCLRCKESLEIEEPQPVWTRRGMPAVRGSARFVVVSSSVWAKPISIMKAIRPDPVTIGDGAKRGAPKLQRDTAYIVYAENDEDIARQIAEDLANSGIATWLHADTASGESVSWAGGVHPALKECSRMVYVLSNGALTDESVIDAWRILPPAA